MERAFLCLFIAAISLLGCNDKDHGVLPSPLMSVSRSPTTDSIRITVFNDPPKKATLQIFDPNHQIVLEKVIEKEIEEFNISLLGKTVGIYKIVRTTGKSTSTMELTNM